MNSQIRSWKNEEFYPEMTEYVLSEDDLAKIQESYEKQFNTWDWTYGQSPEYTVERNVRYPAGKISTYANVENSIIKSVKIYGDFFGIGDVSDIEELLVSVPYSTNMSWQNSKPLTQRFISHA